MPKTKSSLDIEIGKKILELRLSRGTTRKDISGKLGITQQQLHKYEKGINRITVGKLAQVADILDMPITYFFDAIPSRKKDEKIKSQKRCIELMKSFSKIKTKSHQDAVMALVKTLAK